MAIPEVQHHAGFPLCVSLSVEFNQHAVYYRTAEAWARENDESECPTQWVSDEECTKAIAMNSVWTCQWYPITPVGSCSLAASSFEALMAAVNAAAAEGKRLG